MIGPYRLCSSDADSIKQRQTLVNNQTPVLYWTRVYKRALIVALKTVNVAYKLIQVQRASRDSPGNRWRTLCVQPPYRVFFTAARDRRSAFFVRPYVRLPVGVSKSESISGASDK